MLDKKYNHLTVEENKYNNWKENGYFEPTNNGKGKFSIVIPPPNVTGKLHIGHAWDTTLQDIIVRYKRMQGYETMWLPGMDHAAIATESKVVAKLKSEGINKYESSVSFLIPQKKGAIVKEITLSSSSWIFLGSTLNFTPFSVSLHSSGIITLESAK